MSYPAVIKWSGSKRPIATHLADYVTFGETYYEPFVGGGAMMPYAKCNKGIAGDIISELIDLWREIKRNPKLVADEYELRWKELQTKGPDVYYKIRDSFNNTRNCFDFIFLTRTCVNGLIRYNFDGNFNNSFHLSRPGIHPDRLRKIIFKWSQCLTNFEFFNTDYLETLSDVKHNDFVFLDPPYGGTKDRYTRAQFNLETFYRELERLNTVGARWMLTFDGKAGNREYNFAPPKEVYRHKFIINTGNSVFTKVMYSQSDFIRESVYFNYEPSHNILSLL